MKKTARTFLLLFPALALPATSAAQAVTNPDDALDRGYTERPYLRYEAEPGLCATDGSFITSSPYDQRDLASEASGGRALTLADRGSYVSWTLDADADAMCVRFSLPDSPDGTGMRRSVDVMDGDVCLARIVLDSYWAWQYTYKDNNATKYPDNTPDASSKFARMRFDEVNVLLPSTVAAGRTLSLVVADDIADAPLTIDFIELEKAPAPLAFGDIPGDNKVEYTASSGDLSAFVRNNPGKTIYVPAGRHDVAGRIYISAPGTRIVGAGMWHTTLYFTASSDNRNTYGRRGIECDADACTLEGLSLNTVNNKRYFDNNPAYQVGKAIMGSWGRGSTIRDVRADHFECGAWIADYGSRSSEDLVVTDCRFRNNYADGINLSSGTRRARVARCSFRNNGDDDMATWSSGNMAEGVVFEYCSAENNWRASSLGIFGGRGHIARHIAVADAMEAGVRVNCDFDGPGFAADGEILLEDISIRRAGCRGGATGTLGDFWGNANPSLWFAAGPRYALRNITARRISIHDSRYQGVRVSASSGQPVLGLTLEDIEVHGVDNYEYAFYIAPGVRGNGSYSGLSATGVVEPVMSDIPASFDFEDRTSAAPSVPSSEADGLTAKVAADGSVRFSAAGAGAGILRIFAADGREVLARPFDGAPAVAGPFAPGVYIAVFQQKSASAGEPPCFFSKIKFAI